MFYLNTIEQLFLFVEQLFQLEVCLPYSRLLAGIPKLAVFQNLRWNSNKTPLLFSNQIKPVSIIQSPHSFTLNDTKLKKINIEDAKNGQFLEL